MRLASLTTRAEQRDDDALPYRSSPASQARNEGAPMLAGRMMDFPLTVTQFLERAKTYYGRSRIVTRNHDRSVSHTTYAAFYRRTAQLSHALVRLGVRPGDRVATLCWN